MPCSVLRTPRSAFELAFTRTELLVILAVLALLATVVLPALANSRPRSDRVICANNLRQIGAAMQLWGNDNGDLQPWDIPVAAGGTRAHPLAVNVWLHFSFMSNQLSTPRILACPADLGRVARDFGTSPEGGYLNSLFRNNATSYLVGHQLSINPSLMTIADRNLVTAVGNGCSVFNTALTIEVPYYGRQTTQWTTNLHNKSGNILRADGRVDQASDKDLLDITYFPFDDNGSYHLISR
jgi:hypothetical protein